MVLEIPQKHPRLTPEAKSLVQGGQDPSVATPFGDPRTTAITQYEKGPLDPCLCSGCSGCGDCLGCGSCLGTCTGGGLGN